MNMYAGMSIAYQAQQAANAALVSGFTNAITSGVKTYGTLGGFAPETGLGGADWQFGSSGTGFGEIGDGSTGSFAFGD